MYIYIYPYVYIYIYNIYIQFMYVCIYIYMRFSFESNHSPSLFGCSVSSLIAGYFGPNKKTKTTPLWPHRTHPNSMKAHHIRANWSNSTKNVAHLVLGMFSLQTNHHGNWRGHGHNRVWVCLKIQDIQVPNLPFMKNLHHLASWSQRFSSFSHHKNPPWDMAAAEVRWDRRTGWGHRIEWASQGLTLKPHCGVE